MPLGAFIHNCHSLLHPRRRIATQAGPLLERLPAGPRHIPPGRNISAQRAYGSRRGHPPRRHLVHHGQSRSTGLLSSAFPRTGREISRFSGGSKPTDPGQLSISRTLSTSMEMNRSYEASHLSPQPPSTLLQHQHERATRLPLQTRNRWQAPVGEEQTQGGQTRDWWTRGERRPVEFISPTRISCPDGRQS